MDRQDALFEELSPRGTGDGGSTAHSVRLRFSGARLQLAREIRGLNGRELAVSIDVSPSAVTQYEKGDITPASATLKRISDVLRFPVGFFALDAARGVEATAPHFRSLRRTTTTERERAKGRAQLLGELVLRLETYLALPVPSIPRLPLRPDAPDIEARASEARSLLNTPPGPFENVVRTIERHGVVTARLPVETDRVDAFSLWVGARPVVILGSNKNDAARSRFDAAHELGHLVLHAGEQADDRGGEKEANAFAAAVLMPAAEIRHELPSELDWRAFIQLKLKWRVSLAALIRRARDLGTLSEATYRSAMRQMSAQGWRRSEPGDLGRPEQPRFLPRCLELLQDSELPGIDVIAAEANLPLDEVYAFVGSSVDPRPVLTL